MLIFILIILILYTIIIKKCFFKNELENIYYRDIPTKDTPAYVGKIVKGHVDGNDIVATILDLKNRGFIDINYENINGKSKKVLYLTKNIKTTELEEHELFLLRQIFNGTNRVIFDDYIKDKKFKNDFKAFDEMLDRRVERKSTYKDTLLRNINKIIFLTSFLILGIIIFYSIILPITYSICNISGLDKNQMILVNIIISSIIFILIAYKYISYINKSTSSQENLNLKITYIILIILIGIIIIIGGYKNITQILYNELIWYKITINFVLSIITLLYMFNIIKHDEKREYWYYFFLIVSIFAIILNMKFAQCICILFFSTYMFLKSPKHTKLKEENYIYKWYGFKNYLKDYSMLSEQDENAILIWEKYLIYALSLGVNRKIIKKYSKLSNTLLIDNQYLKRFYIEYLE